MEINRLGAGADGCSEGEGLDGATSAAVSPGGKNVYVVSFRDDAVAVFDRNDGIPPQTIITSGPEGLTSDLTPTFGFSSNEPGSSFESRLDAAAFAACSSPKSYSELPDGPHTFAVRATRVRRTLLGSCEAGLRRFCGPRSQGGSGYRPCAG